MSKEKKDSKTVWVTLDTKLYYAQVFENNRDKNEMHSETDGITKVTVELDDEQIEQLKSLGVPETALGYSTFKDYDIDGHQFRGMVLKRPWKSKYLTDDDGNPRILGAPKVFDFAKAIANAKAADSWRILDEHKEEWPDQLLGNRTKAKVKISIYRGKNKAGKPTCVVQLEEIAIVELVPYEGKERDPDEVVF